MAELFEITEKDLDNFRPLLTERTEREFMTDPDILAVGAADRREACGVMLIRVSEDFLSLSYLVVADAYRRRGIATELLALAKEMAYKNEKVLIATFYSEGEETAIYRFFQSDMELSLEPSGGEVYRASLQDLTTLSDRLPKSGKGPSITRFDSLPEEEKEKFFAVCEEEGVRYFDPWCTDYLSPLCLAAKTEDKVSAVLLTRKGNAEDEVFLDYVYSKDTLALAELLRKAAAIALSLPEKVRYLRVASVNEESQKLITSLLPSAVRVGAYYSAELDM